MSAFDAELFEELRKLYSGRGTPWWSRLFVSSTDRLLFLVIIMLHELEQRLERIERG